MATAFSAETRDSSGAAFASGDCTKASLASRPAAAATGPAGGTATVSSTSVSPRKLRSRKKAHVATTPHTHVAAVSMHELDRRHVVSPLHTIRKAKNSPMWESFGASATTCAPSRRMTPRAEPPARFLYINMPPFNSKYLGVQRGARLPRIIEEWNLRSSPWMCKSSISAASRRKTLHSDAQSAPSSVVSAPGHDVSLALALSGAELESSRLNDRRMRPRVRSPKW
mmetsp:Transcript_41141/g.113418  ORF Transcript_41141/g.113418 Transcript_41141/m.113418 type:complete len:226 (+) Transcript_41141:536-1213(+)